MRFERFEASAGAGAIRATAPRATEVEDEVRSIVEEVRVSGDDALRRLTERFDHAQLSAPELRVPADELEAAVGGLEPQLLAGLRAARANVRRVAEAGLAEDRTIELDDGQRVDLREVPVRRAAAYVPAGRAPYPSTVVMCAVSARVAGVEQLAVCAPPGPQGHAHPTILAACTLCGVTEVYRIGGAQAIAALAYGTETIPAVDVVVGPGNRYVQEAKRQLVGRIGIDSVAGPSELVLVASSGAEPELAALDLLAQAEHGADGLLAAISSDAGLLDSIAAAAKRLAAERPSAADASLALVHAADPAGAVRLADELAAEHVQLVGAEVEALTGRVSRAGCLFVGRDAGTAFGDYVAGSNHVLPTGGSARFAGALSPATFRRRMAQVSLGSGAAARLAPSGAAIARAEGFPVHAESMEARGAAKPRRSRRPDAAEPNQDAGPDAPRR